MITIKQDQELVSVESWDQITSRPGYDGNVDPAKTKLKEIIGSYYFSADVPCGLSTCHTPHLKGYIVSTTAGTITNLGNVCGKRHFLVEFVELRRAYDQAVRLKAYREGVTAFKQRVQELECLIDDLRSEDRGADWVHRHINQIRTPGNDLDWLRIALARMVKASDDRVTTTREATNSEIEVLEAQQGRQLPRPHYITEVIGRIEGLEAMVVENDLRSLLVLDLERGLREIANIDVETASPGVLASFSRWAGDVDLKIERAVGIVAAGRKLLTRRNLRQLEGQITGPSEREGFRMLLADLPLGEA